ncbi:hypothetical protein DRP04_08245 [Archaeoglobales archaeon]|nr:MAG: hypothetical protein DRP04_08245 [Archaeoglobales archaeon]
MVTASRSERGLLEPVIKRIEKHPELAYSLLEIKPDWGMSFIFDCVSIWLDREKPDIVLIPCDRKEQVPVALVCLSKNVPIAHFYSGSSIGGNIQDEIYGMIIALCSHIHLCHDEGAAEILRKIGIEDWRIKVVGSTAFDDVILDYSLVPDEPFDLVLINPDTVSKERTERDIEEALGRLWRRSVIIGPNEDKNREIILKKIEEFIRKGKVVCDFYESVSRGQFLALLKKCEHFITNSSSAFYEAPYFSTPCILIGERNKFRKVPPKIVTGASDRIVEILASIKIDEKLLRKRLII